MENTLKMTKDSTNALKDILTDLMSEYKVIWFNQMREWRSRCYDYVWEHRDMWKRWIERKQRLHCDYWREIHWKHARLEKALEEKEKRYRKQLSCEELRYKIKDEYMASVERNLSLEWFNNMNRLVAKCNNFNIDFEHIEISNQRIESGGFSVLIRDGKPRVIDVRTIWAAEHSYLVAPHTRYIITERKTKR